MSLPHFFAGAPEAGETLEFTGEDAHHAISSLRLRPGDELTSSDGRGALARCRIERAEPGRIEAIVLERTEESAPHPPLTVLLAAPKGDRLSWAVQKLTELGVDRIGLLETERSVRRWKGDRAERASDRLEAVAREAAKQSGRRFLPEVAGPQSWEEGVQQAIDGGLAVVLWEEAEQGLLGLLPEEPPDAVTLLVGPEGGISDSEARVAEKGGALLASLGPTLLRTETAAITGASIALAAYGRLGTR